MKRKLHIFIFIFSSIVIYGLQKVYAGDSLSDKKIFYIAYDLAKPVVWLVNNDINGQEVSFGRISNKKYDFSGDLGWGKYLFEKNNYQLDVKGYYIKGGFDKKIITENNDFLSYGLRIAGSSFSNVYSDCNVNDIFFSNITIPLQKQKVFSIWGEFLLKLDIIIIRDISFGWSARIKLPLYFQKDEYFKPYYIPGYGKNNGSAMIGINYYIIYRIPVRN